jgi:trk system potassium uptake protein TrkA
VKAIVVGCGRVGSALAKRLHGVGWEVVAVDESEEALDRLGEKWPGELHIGHGMDTALLEAAGIGSADLVLVATDGDNTNLVVAQIAKERYKVPKVAVRVHDPARAEFYADRGFDVVSPTTIAIEALAAIALEAEPS